MLQRISGTYLWVAFFVAFFAVFVEPAQALSMPVALIAYTVFATLIAAAIWAMGAAKTEGIRVRSHPTFLPGVLLLCGPLVLLLGASVTGEPTAARPGYFLLNTTALLLGSLVLLLGFTTLSARLWEAGERLLPVLGLAGLLVGTALWLANLVFRYAVVASGAASLQAKVEDRAWLAYEYLPGLQGEPSWMEFLLVWTDMLQLAFVWMAYMTAAAYGGALVKVGWVGKAGGGVFVALNLALALAVTVGIVATGSGSTVAAWMVFILTIPFMVFILPYFLGVALVRRGSRWERPTPQNVAAMDVLRAG